MEVNAHLFYMFLSMQQLLNFRIVYAFLYEEAVIVWEIRSIFLIIKVVSDFH